MKRINHFIFLLSICALLTGCANTKHVAYFQNINDVDLSRSAGLYDSRIMPKDELSILVSTTDPAAAEPFNLYTSRGGSAGGASSALSSSAYGGNSYLVSYLVDNEGNINYPVFGKLHVVGMTKSEVQDLIEEKLRAYFDKDEHPIVTVRTSNYRVTIIGEVGGSRVVTINSEKMSIIEALASAGDIGILGKRQNVLIIRETATGEKITHRVNMNDANLFNDPFYYVQQNDIIYVEPLKQKAVSSDWGPLTTAAISLLSLGMTVATFIIALTR